jgi:hypothetical protein
MLILPALTTLLTFVYWRPGQLFEVFAPLTLNAAAGLLILTYVLDLRTGSSRFRGSPLLVLLGAFVFWCVVTIMIRAPDKMTEWIPTVMTSFLSLWFVSEGVQSLRGLKFLGTLLLVFTILLAAFGVHQGLAPTGCYLREGATAEQPVGFDGRSCVTKGDCAESGIPGAEYGCEHAGLFETESIGGRVRFRGILEDPNELAWALSMGLPFCFAFYEGKRTKARLLVLALTVVMVGICVVMTQSRSGQLSLLANLGVYFIRRYRGRGVAIAAVLAIPLLLLGGRSGDEAESSSEERLGCWSEALNMFRENPVIGVGAGQFKEHHYLTAHNSFLLTLAELGPIGFLLWTAAIYFAFKVTLRVQKEMAGRPDAEAALSWAVALFASLTGLVVSAVFLSLSYHPILWTYLGMTGALYAAVRQHDPKFRVRFGGKDLAAVISFDVAFVVAIAIYLRFKGI